jgi:hypothetical protein
MEALSSAEEDSAPIGGRYQRHEPEKSLLYQIITQHYPAVRQAIHCVMLRANELHDRQASFNGLCKSLLASRRLRRCLRK